MTNDLDLVRRIRAGDAAEFERLFRRHYAELAGFAVRYTAEKQTAEDLVQGLFADLWAGRSRWSVNSSVRAYLYRAVRNRALDLRRRASIERDWDEGADRAEEDAMQWSPALPDAEMERAEARRRLRSAWDRLPERCRLVMQLRWHGELSYAEIADVMGISVKGVEIQLSRGLKHLRDEMT